MIQVELSGEIIEMEACAALARSWRARHLISMPKSYPSYPSHPSHPRSFRALKQIVATEG